MSNYVNALYSITSKGNKKNIFYAEMGRGLLYKYEKCSYVVT